jgi:excisionase family DNA binding protein
MNNDILVAEEVAQLLRVDKQRIYELVRTRKLPFILIGERQYRFSAKAVQDWLTAGGSEKQSTHNSRLGYKDVAGSDSPD